MEKIKHILVTGNLGYIGSVVVPELIKSGYIVTGYDSGLYAECLLGSEDYCHYRQIIKDIRNISESDLQEIDAIIHLAALSNDPLGELDPKYTEDINYLATIRLAKIAKKMGIKRFIYSSSQSMYGISNSPDELDEDAPKNPITVYAKTKWAAECELKELCTDRFIVTCFRPSTVFGVSPRLRCDIVFNNLVACAYTKGKIEIKTDGSPWRPVVHVLDVCNAFMAGLIAPSDLVNAQSFNVGILNGNYTVRDLALAAQRAIPGSALVFTGEVGNDARTYRIGFKKILTELKNYYKPTWNLDKGAQELINFFRRIHFSEKEFEGKTCNRLMQIRYLIKNKIIDDRLMLSESF